MKQSGSGYGSFLLSFFFTLMCVCVCYLIIKTGYDTTREVRVLSTRLWVGVMGHERTQTRDQGGVGAVGHERT